MTPFDAFDQGRPLVLDHPIGGERLVAAIWPDGDGIGFADIGWPLNDSRHPFHQVPGPIVGDGPYWRIGPAALRELESWDPLNTAWDKWQAWTAAHPEITPALARSAAEGR
jgi:hypothetical protein